MDCFGNICCDTQRVQGAILFPAACNQYLTQNKSHNYVTIGTINDFYTNASATDILQNAKIGVNGAGYFIDSGKKGRLGMADRIVGFDTNTFIGEYFNEKGTLLSGSDAPNGTINPQWGQVLAKLLQCDINRDNAQPTSVSMFNVLGNVKEKNSFFSLTTTAVSAFWLHAERVLAVRQFSCLSDTTPKRLTKIWTKNGELSIFDPPVYLSSYIGTTVVGHLPVIGIPIRIY